MLNKTQVKKKGGVGGGIVNPLKRSSMKTSAQHIQDTFWQKVIYLLSLDLGTAVGSFWASSQI